MVDGINITEANIVAETLEYSCVTGKQHRTPYPNETDTELLNHMKLCLVLCMSILGETLFFTLRKESQSSLSSYYGAGNIVQKLYACT